MSRPSVYESICRRLPSPMQIRSVCLCETVSSTLANDTGIEVDMAHFNTVPAQYITIVDFPPFMKRSVPTEPPRNCSVAIERCARKCNEWQNIDTIHSIWQRCKGSIKSATNTTNATHKIAERKMMTIKTRGFCGKIDCDCAMRTAK